MGMLLKLGSCSNKHSCNCTTISRQTSWTEHAVLSQPIQREIGSDSKGKTYLAASSNQPCQIIIHMQCTPFSFILIYNLKKSTYIFLHLASLFQSRVKWALFITKLQRILCHVQYIQLTLGKITVIKFKHVCE